MDKASGFEPEDSRFDPWYGQYIFASYNIYFHLTIISKSLSASIPLLHRLDLRVKLQQILFGLLLIHPIAHPLLRLALRAEELRREVVLGELGVLRVLASQPGVHHVVRSPQVEEHVFWARY